MAESGEREASPVDGGRTVGAGAAPSTGSGIIFISHEKSDHGLAVEIRSYLESGGFSCWMAPDDIGGATPWPEQIERAIDSCAVLLVVVSANANDSPHVSREVDLAVEKGKPLLPVRVEDIAPTGTLNYLLRLSQWIDLFPGSIADHAASLQGMAGSILTDRGQPAPPPSPQSPPPKRRWFPQRIAMVALVVLAAAILVIGGVAIASLTGSDDGSEAVGGATESELAGEDEVEGAATEPSGEGDGESSPEPVAETGDGLATSGPGTVTLVSVAADGTPSNDHSANPALSGDGRYVAFDSLASNLVDDDSGAWRDVFVHDRETGETTRVSQVVGEGGAVEEGNGSSHHPRISADGRYVVFVSAATNLDPEADDTNEATDLYLHDRETGLNRRISLAPDGTQHILNSIDPSISDDATLVAYATYPEQARPSSGVGTGLYTAWVHDTTTGVTTRLAEWSLDEYGVSIWSGPRVARGGSMAVSGVHLIGAVVYDRESQTVAEVPELRGRHQTMIPTPDGASIIFSSQESGLVTDDLNNGWDIFTYDRSTGDISMLQEVGKWVLWLRSISSDGNYLSVVSGDRDELADVVVIDTRNGTSTSFRNDLGLLFEDAPEDPGSVELSGDGHLAAFVSGGDTGGVQNVYVIQLEA